MKVLLQAVLSPRTPYQAVRWEGPENVGLIGKRIELTFVFEVFWDE
jgi:hypothetical protein